MSTPATADLSPLQKANVLAEALPWIDKYAGRTIVIKYGATR